MIRPRHRAAFASVALAVGLAWAGSWTWPVAAPHPIERPFTAPATVYSAGHRGIDVTVTGGAVTGGAVTGAAAAGAAAADAGLAGTGTAGGEVIRAPADGVVRFAGTVVDRPVLSLQHANGVLSSYEPVRTDLRAGDTVRRGDPIGVVLPGHCAGTCLHFGVRVNGEYVSPLLFLGGVPLAILWPASGPG